MNYSDFIEVMNTIVADTLDKEPTADNVNRAIDAVEQLQQRDVDFFKHFARALVEDRATSQAEVDADLQHFDDVYAGALLLQRLPENATHGDLRRLVEADIELEQARLSQLVESVQ